MFARRRVARSRSHLCPAINFKLALSYYAPFDAAAKIDFTRVIIVHGEANRNPARRESRAPEFFALPLNQFFRSSARCTFSAHGQAKPIAIGRKSSGALCFLHPKL